VPNPVNTYVVIALNLEHGVYCVAGTASDKELAWEMIRRMMESAVPNHSFGFWVVELSRETMTGNFKMEAGSAGAANLVQ